MNRDDYFTILVKMTKEYLIEHNLPVDVRVCEIANSKRFNFCDSEYEYSISVGHKYAEVKRWKKDGTSETLKKIILADLKW